MKKYILSVLLMIFAPMILPLVAQIPKCELTDIKNRRVVTSEISTSGKVTIISFFATWCKPCLRELNAIHQVFPDWQEACDFDFIAVSIDEAQNRNKVKTLVDGSGWNYTVWLDAAGEFKRAMNVSVIPAIFIVDKYGKIAYSHTGYVDGSENKVIKKVKELSKQ